MPPINYEDGIEYQRNILNDQIVIFMTINETIDIMHRRLGHIGKNRVRYMLNEGLIILPYSDVDKFYLKHICRTCALVNHIKKLIINAILNVLLLAVDGVLIQQKYLMKVSMAIDMY